MNTEKIFSLSAPKLKQALRNEMVSLGYNEGALHNKKDFLYAEGNVPYMLVAHLDTVHTKLPSIICYSKDGNYMMSPQGIGGDDRCGVYIILNLLNKLTFKPYVLFTLGEEVGGIGANAFINYIAGYDIPELKYIVEYDRKGNEDCVFYRCDNADFVEFVEQFGFKEAYGTFSDISTIAPELKVAAVNLSSGYYNPHTEHEYVSFSDMHKIIEKSVKMLTTDCAPFEYIEKAITTSKSYNYYDYYDVLLVSLLPEGTMWVRDFTNGVKYKNGFGEIAIDEAGNLYKYSPYYDDYTRTYSTEAIDEDYTPEFDEENAVTVRAFNYNDY